MMRSGSVDSEPVRAVFTSDFAVAVERRGSGKAVLILAGELDLYRAPDVEKALAEAGGACQDGAEIPSHAVRHLAVDLRLVTFIDSTTLALLLAATRRQQAQGGELHVLVGPRTPTTAFKATGFDRLLAIRRLDDHSAESAS